MNIVNQMIILTIQHENDSQTRIIIGCEDKARSLYHQLVHAGYKVEVEKTARLLERGSQEMARVSALMNEVNHDPVPNRVLP